MQVLRVIAQSMPIIGHKELYARLWSRGDGRERGVVILVHGLGDHGGRFEAFAKRLIKRRWAVFAVDLPGHGRSSGRRGTVKSFNSILRVVASARQTVFERFGDCDQILLGHSMGGNFAVNYALRHAEFDVFSMPRLSGLILVAPMLMPPDAFDRSRIFAAWGTGQLLRWVRISKPARLGQLTRDSVVADRIQTDPLQHSQISLYLATQLLAQGRFAIDRAGENETPTLVVHGDEDQLIDHAACRNLALRMRGSADFVRWTGGRHDLVNDIDADQVADLLSDWMGGKTAGIGLAAA